MIKSCTLKPQIPAFGIVKLNSPSLLPSHIAYGLTRGTISASRFKSLDQSVGADTILIIVLQFVEYSNLEYYHKKVQVLK